MQYCRSWGGTGIEQIIERMVFDNPIPLEESLATFTGAYIVGATVGDRWFQNRLNKGYFYGASEEELFRYRQGHRNFGAMCAIAPILIVMAARKIPASGNEIIL